MRRIARMLTAGVLTLALAGAAAAASSRQAARLEAAGDLPGAARAYEDFARQARGRAAAVAWRAAGLLWVDPQNPQISYEKSLACFRRVDVRALDGRTARTVRAWIAALERLNAAEQTARSAGKKAGAARSALEDAAKSSEALRAEPVSSTAPARSRK